MPEPVPAKPVSLAPVIERKHRLDGSQVDFPCRVCSLQPGREAVIYYLTDRSWEIIPSQVAIPLGSHSFGYFWQDRPYNVYHWVKPSGVTLGYYFNVARDTQIRPDIVEWWDLVLDYWLSPLGEGVFLDEDELSEYIDPGDRSYIAHAKAILLQDSTAIADEIASISQAYLSQILR